MRIKGPLVYEFSVIKKLLVLIICLENYPIKSILIELTRENRFFSFYLLYSGA